METETSAMTSRSRCISRPPRPVMRRQALPRVHALRLPETLTQMQAAVATVIATEGLTNKEVAARLGIAEATVKVHLRRVLLEFGVQTRTQLALAAYGLLKTKG